MLGKVFGVFVICWAFALSFAPEVQAELIYTPWVLTGDPAPGTEPGVEFGYLSSRIRFNAQGQITIHAGLRGPGISGLNFGGFWLGQDGRLELVARDGNNAPGTDLVFGVNRSIHMNDLGQVLFTNDLRGVDDLYDNSVWLKGGDVLKMIAREGDRPLGLPGDVVLGYISGTVLTESGRIVLFSTLRGEGYDSDSVAMLTVNDSGLVPIYHVGGPASGVSAGAVFTEPNGFAVTETGPFYVSSQIEGDNVDATNAWGIWAYGDSGWTLYQRAGDPAPGTQAGVVFGSVISSGAFTDLSSNSSGQIVFSNRLKGFGVDETNDFGVWAGDPDNPRLLSRTGQPAPGTEAGEVFLYMSKPWINDFGRAGFWGRLEGEGLDEGNNGGVWIEEGSGGLRMLAREGQQAPGAPQGVVFSRLHPSLGAIRTNNVGQMLFRASLAGLGVDDTNDQGLWFIDESGSWNLIVQEGDSLNVATDRFASDFRVVERLSISELNDQGQFSLYLYFTDNTEGIFFATVPEPKVLVLMSLGGALVIVRRRREIRASN